ncbi:MAG TPA: hypothetical protein VF329_14555 [Gammaproteobacteria bacterium]
MNEKILKSTISCAANFRRKHSISTPRSSAKTPLFRIDRTARGALAAPTRTGSSTVEYNPGSEARLVLDDVEGARRLESPTAKLESASAKLESILWSALANSGMSFTSIESVECDEFDCEIRFTGGHDQQDLMKAIFAVSPNGCAD